MKHYIIKWIFVGWIFSDKHYKAIVEQFAGVSYNDIFNNYINGKTDYEKLLRDAMNYIGCELTIEPVSKFNEHALGIKVNGIEGICKVTAVYLNSVADEAGIGINDDILTINAMQVKPDASGTNFTEWCAYFGNAPMHITFASSGIVKSATIQPKPGAFYKTIKMQKQKIASDEQKKNFELWSNNQFGFTEGN